MNKPLFSRHAVSRIASIVLLAAAGASLTACYVVPIDTRTGQPYPVARDGSGQPVYGPGAPAPVAAPPLPTQINVRLYPLNAQANKGGMLNAYVTDNNTGHGIFSVAYLGDSLQGESTRVDASYAAFGQVFQEVLGPSPRSFNGRRGIANAHGSRGVNSQCEYLLTAPGAGTGVCRFSDGANYQMHFGG